jgi:hypothetical protein
MVMGLLERLKSEGPKRILALDGGGLRGCVAVGFLERIEALLRERHGRTDLVLRDYFDLIGGTSTGSLIAGILATGRSAAELKEIYLKKATPAFSKKKWTFWKDRYDDTPLSELLVELFGDTILGDEQAIDTGLCIVAKRADTASTWPLINHPEARYYKKNRGIMLRDAIRASGAAPTFFSPKLLSVGGGEIGAFVDGGVSMFNNPALQLFLVATLNGFPYHWPVGEDKLLITSVGTGTWHLRSRIDDVEDAKAWDWAVQVPNMLMEDASWLGQLMLQYLSRTPTAHEIDREIGDLGDDLLHGRPAMTYLRYNAWIEPNDLAEMGLGSLGEKVDSLRDMSATENVQDLYEIGRRAAQAQIDAGHFPEIFDLPRA